MQPPDERNPESHFEKAWKRWAARPTRLSPSEAATRVGMTIRERHARRPPVWTYAAAAVFLMTIGIALHWTRLPNQPTSAPPAAVVQAAPQLGQGEVLMWLDKDTPLYMTFQEPEAVGPRGAKP